MRHWLTRTLLVVGVLFLLIVLPLAWLLGSEAGLNWLLGQAQRYAPGELHVGRAEGRLLGALHLQNVEYRQAELHIKLDDFQFAWRPQALFGLRLHVTRLHADGLDLRLPPGGEAQDSGPLQVPDIRLPLRVALDDVQIQRISVAPVGSEPLVIERITLEQAVAGDSVSLPRLEVQAAYYRFSLEQVSASLRAPHPLAFKLTWQASLPGGLTGAGEAILSGDLRNYRIALDSRIEGPRVPAGHWRLKGHGDFEKFTLDTLRGEVLQGTLQASGEVAWQPALHAALEVRGERLDLREVWADWPQALGLDARITARYQDNGVEIEQLRLALPQAGSEISAQGRVDLEDGGPRLQVALDWKKLHWPLLHAQADAAPQDYLAYSAEGRAELAGTPDAYTLKLDAHAHGADIPAGRWRAEGAGDREHLQISALRGEVLDGTLALNGEVAWAPEPRWQLALQGDKLNPGAQWADWPGQLALNIDTQGSVRDGRPDAEIKISRLQGKLRGYPVQVQGELAAQGERYQVKQLEAQSGKNRLSLKGGLDGQRLGAEWQVQAPDLAGLLPTAGGSLSGQGKLGGTLARPALEATLQGKALAFQDLRLRKLDADVGLKDGQAFRLKLDAAKLEQGKQTLLERLSVDAQGKPEAHTLRAEAQTPKEKLSLTAQGKFDAAKTLWRGSLQELRADTGPLGVWALAAPAELSLGPEQARLARGCLQQRGQSAQLCAQLAWAAQSGGQAQAELRDVPLNLAKPFLPPELSLEGTLNGQLQAERRLDGGLRVDSRLSVSAGRVKTVVDEEPREFSHRGGNLELHIDRAGLRAALDFKLLEHSGMQAELALPGFDRLPLADNQAVQGQARAEFADLALLSTFVPQIKNPQGTLALDLDLAGTAAAPRFSGQARFQDGALELPDLGLDIRKLHVLLKAEGADVLKLDAGFQSGDGQARLSGQAKFASLGDWQADLELKGEGVQVINIPEALALASPDIRARIRPGQVRLDGTLRIPRARLAPNIVVSGGESGAVGLSPDVEIVGAAPQAGEDKPQAARPTAWAVDGAVRVVLGDDIRLEVADFKSRLGGSVALVLKPNQALPIGNGEILIRDGIFRAYGQDLEIRRGQVLFADSPVDNPGLNIKAIRQIRNDPSEDRIEAAGVHIAGTLRNPRLTLFTDPVMLEDRQILSYVLTGGPFEGGDIGKGALSWGMYATPKLYVSIGVSLYESQSTVFNLRYELNKHWGVEAAFGEQDSGVDFSYTLGR